MVLRISRPRLGIAARLSIRLDCQIGQRTQSRLGGGRLPESGCAAKPDQLLGNRLMDELGLWRVGLDTESRDNLVESPPVCLDQEVSGARGQVPGLDREAGDLFEFTEQFHGGACPPGPRVAPRVEGSTGSCKGCISVSRARRLVQEDRAFAANNRDPVDSVCLFQGVDETGGSFVSVVVGGEAGESSDVAHLEVAEISGGDSDDAENAGRRQCDYPDMETGLPESVRGGERRVGVSKGSFQQETATIFKGILNSGANPGPRRFGQYRTGVLGGVADELAIFGVEDAEVIAA